MVTIMNLFIHLMKLSMYDNHGDLQPQVITYQGEVHLHRLQHLLVFIINHKIPTSIWYPLIRRWNDSTYSIGWSNFITSTKDLIINQFPYQIWNMLNHKQDQQLFDKKPHTNKAPGQWNHYLEVKDHKFHITN
jgi:hypothetical protein